MTDGRAVRPEDVLADEADTRMFGGVEVRKGSIAAFVANAKLLERTDAGTEAHDRLADQLRELVPALTAVGVFDVFEIRSERVRAVLTAR